VLVEGSTMSLDPPANQPAQSGGGDVVTHATKNIAVMTMGSFTLKVGGKGACATGDMAAMNVITKQSKVAQMTVPLLEAVDFEAARAAAGGGAAEGTKSKRATPPTPANQCPGGHPVDLGTGYVIDRAVDLCLPGFVPLVWLRSYASSGAANRGGLGRGGWTHSFEQQVEVTESGFRYQDENGLPVEFGPIGADGTSFHRGHRLELRRTGDIIEIRSLADRLVRTFSPLPGGRIALRSIRDAYGHRILLEYEGDFLVKVVDSVKRELRLTNDGTGRVTRVEVWASTPGSEVPATLQTWFDYAYHREGELASHTDALGHAERWEYDGLHRMVKVTLRNGVSFYYEYHPELGHCVRTWGDGGLHDVGIDIDFEKGETCTHRTNRARRYFWKSGVVYREETYDGSWATERVYDEDELLVAVKKGLGEGTTYAYDARGNLTEQTDAAGNTTRFEYQDNLPVRRIDPTELETRYVHDQHGALVGITFPTGVSYVFERDREGLLTAVCGREGARARLSYDAHGNVVKEVSGRGAATSYQCDALGRPVAQTDAIRRVTRVMYDTLGRVVEVVRPDGTRVQAERDPLGNVSKVTDPLGHVTVMDHVGTGHLGRLVQADGQVYHLTYDDDERLIRILNPRLERYEFDYDRADQVAAERTFDGRLIEYRYDRGGRIRRIEYPEGEWRELAYDKLGNVIEDRGEDVQMGFDRDALGRVDKAVCQDVTGKVVTELERDRLGRLVADIQNGRAVRYEYDAEGRRSARILPDGERTEYHYDGEDDAFAAVTHEGRRVAIQRDALGRERSRVASAWRLDTEYDVMDRLLSQRVLGAAATEPLVERRYGYDAKGRVTSIDSPHGGLTTYRYDRIDQLLEAVCGKRREAFEYDPTGSLVAALEGLDRGRKPTWTMAPGNLLLASDRALYVNDGRGRRIKRIERTDGGDAQVRQPGGQERTTTYGWDSKDRLREVVLSDGGRLRFTYDAFGRRVRKDVLSAVPVGDALANWIEGGGSIERRTVQFLWDGDVLCEEIDGRKEERARKRVHVHRPGSFVPLLQAEQGQVFGVVTDYVGMPKELLDERGRVAWRAEHDAWGAGVAVSRAEGTSTIESPFRLLGQYADAETGLAHVRFRYFDPLCARWLSPDPLGFFGGNNALGFDGSPTVVVDPLGLAARRACRPNSIVLERDLTGGKHASDRPMQDVIAEAGQRSNPNGPHGGRPIPIGRWASPEAAEAAAARMNANGAARQVVDLQPGEGTVVYGGVKSYPPDRSAPTWLEQPADKALAMRQEGKIHTFPIDESHYLYGPAGDRP
jgi:RHS repeat-associated protein